MYMLLAKSIFVCLMPIKYLYCIVIVSDYSKGDRAQRLSYSNFSMEIKWLLDRDTLESLCCVLILCLVVVQPMKTGNRPT